MSESRTKRSRGIFLSMDVNPQKRGKSYYRGLFGLYAVLATLLVVSWRRLPDAIVDFGREIYVPWRLSEGDVLYTDIAYFNGPLSPYFNAWVFQCFGASITTLMVTNTLLLVILTTILYHLLSKLVSTRNAVITGLVFLTVFAFSHALRIGNYNYICPYSHEMTHGVALIFAMLMISATRFSQRRTGQLVIGILWGCTFLGKAELFLAATGMLVAMTVASCRGGDRPLRDTVLKWLAMMLGGSSTVFLFFILLSSSMPASQALTGIAGTWYWIFNSDVTGGEFYRRMSGFDQPIANLSKMLGSVVVIGLAILFAKSFESWRTQKRGLALCLAGVSLVAILWLNQGLFPLLLHGMALPVIALVLMVAVIYNRFRPGSTADVPDWLVGWVCLAGLLLAKFPLRTTVVHYGFVLAMPVVLISIAWTLERLPKVLCSRTGGVTCYSVLCLMLFADVIGNSTMTLTNIRSRNQTLGQAGDLLMVDARRGGGYVSDAIQFLRDSTSNDDRVVVLPEGVMLNYQARRNSSWPYVNLCPPELRMYGELQIRDRLAESPAEFIVLVNKDVREYGKSCFGAPGYGQNLKRWIDQNYTVIQVFGNSFAESTEPGVTILQRNTAPLVW